MGLVNIMFLCNNQWAIQTIALRKKGGKSELGPYRKVCAAG